MRIGYNWLKDYIEFPFTPYELAEKLTMIGLEVGGIFTYHKGLDSCNVGKINKITPHPNADKLCICLVDIGDSEIPVVCGASNIKTGDKVPVALKGAILANNTEIKETCIRGVRSEGMLCSESELGLSPDCSGIMILPNTSRIGAPLSDALNITETVLEIDLTPNRADCLSHLGIAREIGAIIGQIASLPNDDFREEGDPVNELMDIEIVAPDLCYRYVAKIITGVTIAPSPSWLVSRLESVGFRSINNVVDVTNYVLMETGQPLHAFDYDLIQGKRIIVRPANNGESLQTLDGVNRELDGSMLMIADENHAIALAGIMGGVDSEITENTKNILLESAFFEPTNNRRTSKKLGLSTEASQRFEKGIDIEGVLISADRAAQLILQVAEGRVAKGAIDIYKTHCQRAPIMLRTQRVKKILGIDISSKRIYSILKNLSFRPLSEPAENMEYIPPSFRQDIFKEIDIIEEVARFYGYNNIPTTIPSGALPAGEKISKIQVIENIIRNFLISAGFFECINYSFTDKKLFDIINFSSSEKDNTLIEIKNPLTEEQNVLRQSVIPALIQNLLFNQFRSCNDLKIFEIGTCFYQTAHCSQHPKETKKIGILLTGSMASMHWSEKEKGANFFDLKGIVEGLIEQLGIQDYSFAPLNIISLDNEKALKIVTEKTEIGFLGRLADQINKHLEIKQPAFIAELFIDNLIQLSKPGEYKFSAIPKFPPVLRDIAIVIDEDIPYGEIVDLISREGGILLEDVKLFDIYLGPQIPKGKKSLAFALSYRSKERTLTDEEVNNIHEIIVKKLNSDFQAELR